MLSKTYKNLLEFYQAKLKEHGLHKPQALSYNSRTTQELRFAQFLKLIPKNKTNTVLDVGCGLGDLSDYLARHGYTNTIYTGIDIVPEMISGAQQKHPKQKFSCQDIFALPAQAYDYVVASGALNIIYTTPEEQLNHIEKAIETMFACAKKGLAFNLLNADAQEDFEQDAHFYYSHPTQILNVCQKLDPRAQLIDNYLDYDFTIVMRKNH